MGVIDWSRIKSKNYSIGAIVAVSTLVFMTQADSLAAPVTQPPQLHIAPTGPIEPVFTWQSMRCEEWDVPDSAARAWRDAQGHVHLLASHLTNRAMSGPDLDHLQRDCRVVFKGGAEDAPERYDDRSWIASTYTLDGNTVFGLVHNEFHAQLRPALCPSRDYMKCWSNALTLVESHDGGLSFAHAAAPQHLVAGIPYRYRGDVGHPIGYFNPSNIVFRDGFHYAFFWAEDYGAQRRGACLMRTNDLADHRSWRAWDGQDFTVGFSDPYTDDVKDDTKHVCAVVGGNNLISFVSSVTLHRPSGNYIALMASTYAETPGAQAVPGIFASISPDLIHWERPVLVRQATILAKTYDCSGHDVVFYPSLLDPRSPSRNFEDTGDRAYLYFTDMHLAACRVGTDRDLVRVPVDISPAGRS